MITQVQEFVLYLQGRYRSPQTIKAYVADVTEFAEFCGGDPVHTSSLAIQNFLDASGRKNKVSTTARKAATLRTFFKWASRDKGISNPFLVGITTPKVKISRRHCLTATQVSDLIQNISCDNNMLEARDKAICIMIVECGLRVSEIEALNIGDLNASNSRIKVGKRGLDVSIALPLIEQYFTARWKVNHQQVYIDDPLAPLFINKHGGRLNPRSIRRKIAMYGRRIGVSASPRNLRHTFANNFLQSGGSLNDLSSQLGQSNVTTKVYADPSMVEVG